jgi:hypothetical protein
VSEGCIRIECLTNGYTVSVDDPKIRKKNDERDNSKGPYTPWQDPERKFAFTTEAQVIAFVTKNLKKVMPAKKAQDYETSFDTAVAAEKD